MKDGVVGSAHRFIRNPLGIIGLFIVMIYCTTVIISGLSHELTDDQRGLLVAFGFIFPFVVLFVFHNLVVHHHSKLYSPGDWKNEQNFFGPQTELEKNLKELKDAEEVAKGEDDLAHQNDLVEETAQNQSTQHVKANRVADSIGKVIESETLGFLHLTEVHAGQLIRNVTIHGGPKMVQFDAISEQDNVVTLFEIKFIRSVRSIVNLAEKVATNLALASAAVVNSSKPRRLDFYLLFVTEGLSVDEQAKVHKIASEKLDEIKGTSVVIDMIDISVLRSRYGD